MRDKHTALIDFASTITNLKPNGRNLLGCCPIHGEKTPSFHIRADSGRAHCFGCGFHGDVFDLYMKTQGGTYLDAKKALGFWDHSRPEPRIKRKVFPREIEYKEEDKREIYITCVEALQKSSDIKIIMPNGISIWNHEFVLDCLRIREDWEKFVIKILEKIESDTKKNLAENYFYSALSK